MLEEKIFCFSVLNKVLYKKEQNLTVSISVCQVASVPFYLQNTNREGATGFQDELATIRNWKSVCSLYDMF